jgi:nitrous oxide reductase accessory protein NosL
MVEWLEKKSFKKEAKIWVYTLDTNQWIDAKKAWYGVTDKTAMHSGFGAREEKIEKSIDFSEMSLRALRGETLANPKIRKKLLGH